MSEPNQLEILREQIVSHLKAINLSEDWTEEFLDLLIELAKQNTAKSDELLDKGDIKFKALLRQENSNPSSIYTPPTDLLANLAERGACVQPVTGCFVQADSQKAAFIAGDGKKVKPPRFVPKFERIINALYENGLSASDITIYTAGVAGNMMRKAPYYLIEIPRLNLQIAVSDQIGEIGFYSKTMLPLATWAESRKPELVGEHGVVKFRYSSNPDWGANLVGAAMTNTDGMKIDPRKSEKVKQPAAKKEILLQTQILEWAEIYREMKEEEDYAQARTLLLDIVHNNKNEQLLDLVLSSILLGKSDLTKNKYPSQQSGEIFERDYEGGYKPTGRTWKDVDNAFRKGKVDGWEEGRGALPDFLELHGVKDKRIKLAPPSQEDILDWAIIHHESKGKYPSAASGDILERDGDGGFKPTGRTWSAVKQALTGGTVKGWEEGRGGLPDFLKENGLINRKPATDIPAEITKNPDLAAAQHATHGKIR